MARKSKNEIRFISPYKGNPTPINIHFDISYNDGDIFFLDEVKDISSSETTCLSANILMLCTKGQMQININGRTVQIRKGDILLCPPNVILSDYLFSTDYECKICLLTERIMEDFLRSNISLWNNAIYINKVNLVHIPEESLPYNIHLYEALRFLIKEKDHPYRKEKIQGIASVMLIGLCGMLNQGIMVSDRKNNSRQENVLHAFLHLLNTHRIKRHSVEFYSQQLHLTPKYLSQICKRVSGKIALEWIKQYILEDVRYYLRNTDLSIKEIAEITGFPSISFFGKYIKRHLGISPVAYRRELRD